MGFYIGPIFIAYYGGFIALGILIAAAVGYFQVKKFNKSIEDFIIIAAVTGLGGFLGAKVLYIILSWEHIDFSRLSDVSYLNSLLSSGFVFYGGLLGGLLALFLCKKLFKFDLYTYITIGIPCIPVAHAFGRFGCSAVGCCYGVPYNGPAHIVYHNSPIAPNHIGLFPVQIVEAVCNLFIALILCLYIDTKKDKEKHSLSLYLLMYAPLRFALEYFRYDYAERGKIGFLSTSQFISIVIFVIVILHMIYIRYKNREAFSK